MPSKSQGGSMRTSTTNTSRSRRTKGVRLLAEQQRCKPDTNIAADRLGQRQHARKLRNRDVPGLLQMSGIADERIRSVMHRIIRDSAVTVQAQGYDYGGAQFHRDQVCV